MPCLYTGHRKSDVLRVAFILQQLPRLDQEPDDAHAGQNEVPEHQSRTEDFQLKYQVAHAPVGVQDRCHQKIKRLFPPGIEDKQRRNGRQQRYEQPALFQYHQSRQTRQEQEVDAKIQVRKIEVFFKVTVAGVKSSAAEQTAQQQTSVDQPGTRKIIVPEQRQRRYRNAQPRGQSRNAQRQYAPVIEEIGHRQEHHHRDKRGQPVFLPKNGILVLQITLQDQKGKATQQQGIVIKRRSTFGLFKGKKAAGVSRRRQN